MEVPSQEAIRKLNDLLALQHDYLAANASSQERLFRDEARATARTVQQRHRKQVEELAETIRTLGGTPRMRSDLRRLISEGRVLLADMGGDRHVLRAMRANAEELQAAYDKARAVNALPEAIEVLLGRHVTELANERSWLEDRRRDVEVMS
jgi:hypothetical protein